MRVKFNHDFLHAIKILRCEIVSFGALNITENRCRAMLFYNRV